MNTPVPSIIADLPGFERIGEGLRDFHDGRHTPASCLVRMARRRLVTAGLMSLPQDRDIDAELDLYRLLSDEGDAAYGRYNALVRELVSFEHALDHRLRRRAGAGNLK